MTSDETKPEANENRDVAQAAALAESANANRAAAPEANATHAYSGPVWVLTHEPEADAASDLDPDKKQFLSYIRMLFVPTIFTKTLIMFFGLNYAMYPGEGYGYGLAVAICFSICTFSYFVWSQTRRPSK